MRKIIEALIVTFVSLATLIPALTLAVPNNQLQTDVTPCADNCQSGQVCISGNCLTSCTITATGVDFGIMHPGTTSADAVSTLTNAGSTATTNLFIKGTDWSPANPNMLVGQTKWSLALGTLYNSMTTLTSGDVSLGSIVGSGTLPVYFKLNVPVGTSTNTYTQTLTLTASC